MPRIISDVHGDIQHYLQVAKDSPDGYSIQLGDLGFNYDCMSWNLNVHKNVVIMGNHDNYDDVPWNCIGPFGGINFVNDSFFVRGASSIDAMARIRHYLLTYEKTWWYEEELQNEDFKYAYELFGKIRPRFMFSHEAPTVAKDEIARLDLTKFGLPSNYSSRTQQWLQMMYEVHQPDYWFFGHYHVNFTKKIGNTTFVCIRDREFIDVNFGEL